MIDIDIPSVLNHSICKWTDPPSDNQPNSDTTKQFEKIYDLYRDDVADYKNSGPGALGRKYFQEAATVLGQAFDIAIATETSKNKDKR